MFLTGDQVWLQHQLSWLCLKLIKHKLLCICDACNLSCLFHGYCILGFVTWLQLRQSQIFQEMWFFCTIWHKVPLMCTSNLAPMAYSFEANYQLIWEPILCHLHIESRTVLYTSLAEKAHHFHGVFALSVRFPVTVFSITMWLQFIALTEFDPHQYHLAMVLLDLVDFPLLCAPPPIPHLQLAPFAC
jgi:hypothetical protein